MTVSQDNRIRKPGVEISMLKTINPAFLPVFFNLSFVLTECGRSTVDKTDVRYIQHPDVRAISLLPLIP